MDRRFNGLRKLTIMLRPWAKDQRSPENRQFSLINDVCLVLINIEIRMKNAWNE